MYVVAGESCTLPAVTLAGYTLSGWYTQSGPAGNESYTSVGVGGESYAPGGDVTLYARWALNAPDLDAGARLFLHLWRRAHADGVGDPRGPRRAT